MSILASASSATKATFGTVTATANVITAVAESADNLAQVALIHAKNYRETSEQEIAITKDLKREASKQEAMLATAERMLTVQKRLNANAELTALYRQLDAPKKPELVAAE